MSHVVALSEANVHRIDHLFIALFIGLPIVLVAAIWRAVYWHRRMKAADQVNPPGADDGEYFNRLNEKPATERGARHKLSAAGFAVPATPDVRVPDPDFVDAHVIAEEIRGWNGFEPFEVLDQLRRAADGDVSQRLLKWRTLGPLIADPSREVAPEFARLISRVGVGALAIQDGEPAWDECMTGTHRLVTCPELTGGAS